MMRQSGVGGAQSEVLGTASTGLDAGRLAKGPGIALLADLGKSLRLLDDEQLDRLMKAVTEEARRRGRDMPEDSHGGSRPGRPEPAKSARAKAGASAGAAGVTPGQERLILAAHEAGLRPAANAREFRLSRAAVQNVIASAKRTRRGAGR